MISKDEVKKYAIKLVKWIISNTIWTIISLIIPFALLIPTFESIFKSITTKTYSIKLTNIIWIVIFVVIETVLLIVIVIGKKKTVQKNKEIDQKDVIQNKEQTEIDYDKLDYYFKSYHKHLTVYSNGNGILINSFTVVINNINSITEFKREINISDAKVNTRFPKFSMMKKAKLSERFNRFGFWCQCLNNKGLIRSVRESYWSDDTNGIDTVSQSDPKILKWVIEMNPSSIEVGKPYDIVYIMSIPDMFPIENGRFSESIANIKGTHGKFQSGFEIKHIFKEFKYTVSFENGLELYTKPTGTILVDGKKRNLHYENDNNIIFDKYIFNTSSPKCNSVINIEWYFKDNNKTRKRKTKNGGNNYGNDNKTGA